MAWVIEIAKSLIVCAATAFFLAAFIMFSSSGNAKATGVDLLFRLTGARLALVGVVNVAVGLLLTRLTIIGDAAGHVRVHLR